MAGRKRKLTQKYMQTRKLRDKDVIQITIAASEINLQRIAALMLFSADPIVREEYVIEDAVMPFDEDAAAEAFDENVDYEAVRLAIVKLLEQYVNKFGAEKAREVLKSFNAKRLSEVAREHLLGLHDGLDSAVNGKKPKAEDVPWDG